MPAPTSRRGSTYAQTVDRPRPASLRARRRRPLNGSPPKWCRPIYFQSTKLRTKRCGVSTKILWAATRLCTRLGCVHTTTCRATPRRVRRECLSPREWCKAGSLARHCAASPGRCRCRWRDRIGCIRRSGCWRAGDRLRRCGGSGCSPHCRGGLIAAERAQYPERTDACRHGSSYCGHSSQDTGESGPPVWTIGCGHAGAFKNPSASMGDRYRRG